MSKHYIYPVTFNQQNKIFLLGKQSRKNLDCQVNA